ncbi:unnamed protein product, partial [Effrenium voratum]
GAAGHKPQAQRNERVARCEGRQAPMCEAVRGRLARHAAGSARCASGPSRADAAWRPCPGDFYGERVGAPGGHEERTPARDHAPDWLLSKSGADIPAAMAKLSNSLAPPRATHRATSAAASARSRAGRSRREGQGCKRPGRQRAADAARSAEIATPAKQPKQNHAQHAQNGPWPRRSSGRLPATQSIAARATASRQVGGSWAHEGAEAAAF